MNPFLQRLARDAAAPLIDFGVNLAKKVVLILIASLFLFATLIFLTIAFFTWLASELGQPFAALIIGGLYLLGAVLTLTLALSKPAPEEPVSLRARLSGQTDQPQEMTEAEKEQAAHTAAEIDTLVAPLLSFLQNAGLERERLAIIAGATVAKQLRGYSLIVACMAAGFITGRFYFTKSGKSKS